MRPDCKKGIGPTKIYVCRRCNSEVPQAEHWSLCRKCLRLPRWDPTGIRKITCDWPNGYAQILPGGILEDVHRAVGAWLGGTGTVDGRKAFRKGVEVQFRVEYVTGGFWVISAEQLRAIVGLTKGKSALVSVHIKHEFGCDCMSCRPHTS